MLSFFEAQVFTDGVSWESSGDTKMPMDNLTLMRRYPVLLRLNST